MGLLDKLFEKKYCSICGEKLGLLGTAKLEDGFLCKDCVGRLSPWYDVKKTTTLQEVQAHLAYRQENQKKAANFKPTKTFGKYFKMLYIDESMGMFAVGTATELNEKTIDLIPMSAVTDCRTYNQEHRTERKTKDKDGKPISYNPPIYDYTYDFFCEISVNHPFISVMKFKLNNSEVKGDHAGAVTMSLRGDFGVFTAMSEDIREAMQKKTDAAPGVGFDVVMPDLYCSCEDGLHKVDIRAVGRITYRVEDPALFAASSRERPAEDIVTTCVRLALMTHYTNYPTKEGMEAHADEIIGNVSGEVGKIKPLYAIVCTGVQLDSFTITNKD